MNLAKKVQRTIGIMGGSGPNATIDLQRKLACLMKKCYKVTCDQDHLRVVVDNNPYIPDRNDALLSQGESPVSYYIDGIQQLVKLGAEIIILPCITAHAFFETIQANCQVKIINMITETTLFISTTYPEVKRFGLLSTPATAACGLYHKEIEHKLKKKLVIPESSQSPRIHEAIKLIKCCYDTEENKILLAKDLIMKEIIHFSKKGVHHIILGCTELPLLFAENRVGNSYLIDPTYITAEAAIKYLLI